MGSFSPLSPSPSPIQGQVQDNYWITKTVPILKYCYSALSGLIEATKQNDFEKRKSPSLASFKIKAQ